MQKACRITAISAIALSASQFASAQTSSPDRSARTADQSSAAREAVKSTLRDAGFTNIRIMSESFLVHAIDQNGDPVVMVVRPDSRAIMPEASEGHDEANAPEPGYSDSLTDLSEDEDEATARTPRGGRIGKSSKMTDRPPYPGDEERADAGQRADQDTAKSGKMTAGGRIRVRPNGRRPIRRQASRRRCVTGSRARALATRRSPAARAA